MIEEKFHLHEYLIESLISNSPQSNSIPIHQAAIREYSFITFWPRVFVRKFSSRAPCDITSRAAAAQSMSVKAKGML